MKHTLPAPLALLCAMTILFSASAAAQQQYAFKAHLGNVLGTDGAPANTTVIACHDWDRNQWKDHTVQPWQTVDCDARYGANVWVKLHVSGKEFWGNINAPHTNPCGYGRPVYDVDLTGDGDINDTDTSLEITRYRCD